MPSNNTLAVEVNVVNKNDPIQTAVHETTIASLKPVSVSITAGQTAKVNKVRPSVGNADAGEVPGDVISTLLSDGTCPPGTLGTLTFLGATSPVVRGGALKTGTLSLTMTSAQVQTPNKLSPQRCIVTVSAAGPGGDSDGTNNTTRLVIDVLDQNDY